MHNKIKLDLVSISYKESRYLTNSRYPYLHERSNIL